MEDVQIELSEEEFVVDMVQSGRLVDIKDVPTMPSGEEFVKGTVHTRSNKSSRAEIKLMHCHRSEQQSKGLSSSMLF